MNGFRAQVGWLMRGRAQTATALDALSRDLRELQAKVATIETAIRDVQTGQRELGTRQLAEFDAVRSAVAVATDDLSERMNSLHAQVRAHQ
jgi:peptidoglycan hydrolase CwlO-like protein